MSADCSQNSDPQENLNRVKCVYLCWCLSQSKQPQQKLKEANKLDMKKIFRESH